MSLWIQLEELIIPDIYKFYHKFFQQYTYVFVRV